MNSSAPLKAKANTFLRTLYLHEQGAMLRLKGERFVVTPPGEEQPLLALPARKVEQIIVFGTCHLTPAALHSCLKRGIPVTLLSSTGTYYGRIESTLTRNVTLERLQFLKTADETFALDLGRRIVQGKLRPVSAVGCGNVAFTDLVTVRLEKIGRGPHSRCS